VVNRAIRRGHDRTAAETRQSLGDARRDPGQGRQISRGAFSYSTRIEKLQRHLNEFNDRIIELENEGHRGRAMKVLKANALDFARRIDELRCLLIDSRRS
jgi:hypothetical protein